MKQPCKELLKEILSKIDSDTPKPKKIIQSPPVKSIYFRGLMLILSLLIVALLLLNSKNWKGLELIDMVALSLLSLTLITVFFLGRKINKR